MDVGTTRHLGTILGVWAHPDDETWASAGLMMTAALNGQRVAIVTATRGELGSTDSKRWPLETLGRVRQNELAAALSIIGVAEHYWLDYHDGDCPNVASAEACRRLKKVFETVRPDTILTFGPDGLTGHADHTTVGNWARAVAADVNSQPLVYEVVESKERYAAVGRQCNELLNMYFNTPEPYMLPEAAMDICFKLSPEQLDKKIACLRAHTSQTEKLMECLENGMITSAIASPECFVKSQP